jgi:hypothetical protein
LKCCLKDWDAKARLKWRNQKYSADSYERKKSAERAKNKGLKKDIIDIQEKAIYESHENKLVYTYVLKDIQKNIYKIGKTADPHARFKSLCVRQSTPIALVNKDVEDILHAKYADNRIVNEDYKLNGATEWFRPGGKFDEFIARDKGVFLPYVTLHSLVQDLLENKTLDLTTQPQNGSYHRTSLGTIL